MFFKDILGKTTVKQNLINVVDKSRIPHAQIFLGKEGSGALPMALAFASYILCNQPSDGDSCGHCSQCIKSHKFIHPDMHFSFPVVKFGDKKRADTTSDDFLSKWRSILLSNPNMSTTDWLQHIGADNNLPNINVKECNDIMHKLNMMSYESEKKILIMWLPEYLHTEGNRLLKLIEEPTDNTYIILVAENQDQILQTILSRCQLIKIPPFENSELALFLEKEYNILSEKAIQYANLVDGNIVSAINVAKNETIDYSNMLISWLRIAYTADPADINEWIRVLAEMPKDDQKNFFEYGLHFFRQFNYRLLSKSDQVSLTKSELDTAGKLEKIITLKKSESLVLVINEAIENINRNINIRIMLFADTLTINKILLEK